MAETLISPGYLTRENDQSQTTQLPISVGAAFVGPTVKGPVKVPTVVRSYSDYLAKFGGAFISGGATYSYLTTTAVYNYFNNGGQTALVTRVVNGTYTPATASISGSTVTAALVLETLSEGVIMNTGTATGSNGTLVSGSADNIKWQIVSSNTGSGTFSLLIRRGDDTATNIVALETWNNLSLDPNADNFVSKVIGDQDLVFSNNQITVVGSYPNASNYVRVKSVVTTPNYFDNSGAPRLIYSGSLPALASGSFGGAQGSIVAGAAFYDQVTTDNIQGISGSDYTDVLALLSNKDDYRFNVLSLPGLTYQNASSQISTAVANIQDRGDAIVVVDLSNYGETQVATIGRASDINSSYATTYWPWTRVADPATGRQVWVPASTLIPGVYAYSDRVSAPWFAPAGLNRGALSNVTMVEKKLAASDRDALYAANINPIATFPNAPAVVYGQKTLQKKASALDRVNVRRLLIELKTYIGQIANTLVFDQNSDTTRLSFLGRVNPYLENIQQRQGLYAFRVIMDDSNNTADVIDRNQLVGQIYIQPTRTAEFVILDFNIQPTGATFPS
jgi:hypothetical protein